MPANNKSVAAWYLSTWRHIFMPLAMPVIALWTSYVIVVNVNRNIAEANAQATKKRLEEMVPQLPEDSNGFTYLRQADKLRVRWDFAAFAKKAGYPIERPKSEWPTGEESDKVKLSSVMYRPGMAETGSPLDLFLRENQRTLELFRKGIEKDNYSYHPFFPGKEQKKYFDHADLAQLVIAKAYFDGMHGDWQESLEWFGLLAKWSQKLLANKRVNSTSQAALNNHLISMGILNLLINHWPEKQSVTDSCKSLLLNLPNQCYDKQANEYELLLSLHKYDSCMAKADTSARGIRVYGQPEEGVLPVWKCARLAAYQMGRYEGIDVYTQVMENNSFRRSPHAPRYAPRYYPDKNSPFSALDALVLFSFFTLYEDEQTLQLIPVFSKIAIHAIEFRRKHEYWPKSQQEMGLTPVVLDPFDVKNTPIRLITTANGSLEIRSNNKDFCDGTKENAKLTWRVIENLSKRGFSKSGWDLGIALDPPPANQQEEPSK